MPRTPEEIQAALRSFMDSRTLLTAIELDLFSAVGEGATGEEVAARIAGEPRATGMLLDALAALGVLVKYEGRYACTEASGKLGPQRSGLMHLVHQWEVWSTLTACVKAGTTVLPERLAGQDPAGTEAFIQAMHARARALAPELAARLGTRLGTQGVVRMLDVGGGPGTFALAFAGANPLLRAEVLDLPAVLPIARRIIQEAGLGDRVTVRAGDLKRDDLGRGYDLILVSAICHMLSEAENRDLLGRCAQALAPGGRLVIRDFILDPDRAGPKDAAVFALNMLVGTRGGNTYTESEYRAWLAEAGLPELTRLEGVEQVLVARAPVAS